MLLIFLVSIFCSTSFAQTPFYQTPKFHQIADFNKSAYSGLWYEIFRIPNFIEINEICSTVKFEYNKPLETYNLILNAVNPKTKVLRNSIAALLPKKDESSSFTFRYPIKPPINLGVMTILDTDYENYAVKAAVMAFRKFYLVFAWIDSRTLTISPEHYYRAVDVLRVNKIPLSAIVQIEQTCPNIVQKKH